MEPNEKKPKPSVDRSTWYRGSFFEPIPFSRRVFLAGSTGAFATPALANGFRPPTVEVTSSDGVPDTLLKIAFQNYRWELKSSDFGVDATFRLDRDDNAGWDVSLLNGKIVGTDIAFPLKIAIKETSGWTIDFTVDPDPLQKEIIRRKKNAVNKVEVNKVQQLALIDWLSSTEHDRYEIRFNKGKTFTIGGRSIYRTVSDSPIELALTMKGVDSPPPFNSTDSTSKDTTQQGPRNVKLQMAIASKSPLRLHIWAPGNPLVERSETTILFDNAIIDHKAAALQDQLIKDHPEIKTLPSNLEIANVTNFVEFRLNRPRLEKSGVPLLLVKSHRSVATQPSICHKISWIPFLADETDQQTKNGFNVSIFAFEVKDPTTQKVQKDELICLAGTANLEICGPAAHANGSRMKLSSSSIIGRISQFHNAASFAGTISDETMLETKHNAFVLEPNTTDPERGPSFQINCERNYRNGFDYGVPQLTIPVKLARAHLPVPEASLAAVDYWSNDGKIIVGDPSTDDSAGIQWPLLYFGKQFEFKSPLHAARLLLKRSLDLFDMMFEFSNYWLTSINGATELDRYVAPRQRNNQCNQPTLVAIFPPQHVQEEVFTNGAEPDNPADKCDSIETIRHTNWLQTDNCKLARSVNSSYTRIAMAGGELDKPFRLTIESLTDWQNLALAVHRRALDRNSDLTAHLQAMNLEPETPRQDARGLWRTAMLELKRSPYPDADKDTREDVKLLHEYVRLITQIEAVSGLIVSPDESAKFLTSQIKPARDQRNTVWTAKLASKLNSSFDPAVRVIHAAETLLSFTEKVDCGEPDFTPFISSLTARDRMELLVLTSGFALPSLRRLQPNDKKELSDDPKGMVFRPDEPLTFLSNAKNKDNYQFTVGGQTFSVASDTVFEEGLLVPRPFRDFALTLSSLRACLRSTWEGEPPAPLDISEPKCEKFYNSALNIQGYTHNTMYGRDIFVQVAYKGFLFPIGHRATMIKTTERRFLPYDKDDGRNPVAYLIKTTQIVCEKPLKAYPALGQPNSGRAFPTSQVELITVTTPEIIDPADYDDPHQYVINETPAETNSSAAPASKERNSCNGIVKDPAKKVFWPRTAPAPNGGSPDNVIQFEYRVDGSNTPVKSPLLFVNNAAAHDSATMGELVKYYNELKNLDLPLCTATHAKAMRIYSPSINPGDTSFETHKWHLGAEGRTGASSGPYSMDALMEGADQPPFYPVVKKAFVTMQSLDRLLGRSQGQIETAFNNKYITYGLDPTNNPSEIFLDVLTDNIDLNLTSQGQSAGGVAQPNARLAAISRKKGMIGGQPRNTAPVAQTAGSGQAAVAAQQATASERKFDISSAEQGKFDPAEFLGGGIGNAKLLGIVPLKDVLRVVAMNFAPELKEVEGFADSVAEDAKDIAKAFSQVLVDTRNAINENLSSISPDTSRDPFTLFYPELAQRFDAFQKNVETITSLKQPAEVVQHVSKMIASGKALLAALESTARNPKPAFFDDYMQKIKDLLQQFTDKGTVEGLKKFVQKQVEGIYKSFLNNLKDEAKGIAPALKAMFGKSNPADILRNPSESIQNLNYTAYTEAFARPFLKGWSEISSLLNVTLGRITWSNQRIARDVALALFNGNTRLVARVFNDDVTGPTSKKYSFTDFGSINNELSPHNKLTTVDDAYAEKIRTFLSQDKKSSQDTEKLQQLYETVEGALITLVSYIESNGIFKELSDHVNNTQAIVNTLYGNVTPLDSGKLRAFLTKCQSDLGALQSTKVQSKRDVENLLNNASQIVRENAYQQLRILEAEIKQLKEELDAIKKALNEINSTKIKEEIQNAFKKELNRSVEALRSELETLARSTLEDILGRLLQGLGGLFEVINPIIAIVDLAQRLGSNSKVILEKIQSSYTVRINKIEGKLKTTKNDLLHLTVNSDVPAHYISAINGRLALIRACVTRIESHVVICKAAIETLKNKISNISARPQDPKIAKDINDQINVLLQSTEKVQKDFREFVQEVQSTKAYIGNLPSDVKVKCSQLTEDLSSLASDLVVKFKIEDEEISQTLKAHDSILSNYFSDLMTSYGNAKELHDQAITAINAQVETSLSSNGGSGLTNLGERQVLRESTITDSYKNLAEFARKEAEAIGVITSSLAVLQDEAINKLKTFVGEFQKDFVDSFLLIAIYTPVSTALEETGNLVADNELVATVLGPAINSLNQAKIGVNDDIDALSNIRNVDLNINIKDIVTNAKALLNNWQTNGPGIVQAARIISTLVQSLMKGQLASFIDFSQLRAMLEEKLFELVPTSFSQSYTWDTELDDFPGSDPIFLMDQSDKGKELRRGDKSLKNDLTLDARVSVNLLNGERKASAIGRIAPFSIKLLGDAYDLITINFKGATFETGNGKTKYSADVRDVVIGTQLEFLQELQQYFTNGGDGVFINFSANPPAIETGYRVSTPIITLGTLSFINVAFAASVLLPFDQKPALFKFAFASRDNPFLISQPPYGGGGFVGIIANARGIVGLEIQFEFGAVVPVDVGVLKGHGSVTTGIYLSDSNDGSGQDVLEGFVKAVGSGQISCFSTSVNMEIRVRQVTDGNEKGSMKGSATYGFAFKLSLLSYKYLITAEKTIKGGNSRKATPSSSAVSPVSDTTKQLGSLTTAQIKVSTPRKTKKWDEYRKNLAL